MNKLIEYTNILCFWVNVIAIPIMCAAFLFRDELNNNWITSILNFICLYYIIRIAYYGAKKVFIEEPYNKLYDQSEEDDS